MEVRLWSGQEKVENPLSPLQGISITSYLPKTRYRKRHVKIVQTSYLIFPTWATDNRRVLKQSSSSTYITYLANGSLLRTDFTLAACAPLVVIYVGCAVRLGCRVEWLEVTILFLRNDWEKYAVRCNTKTYSSKDMAKVPDLREGFPTVLASEVWKGTSLSLESILDIGQWVGSLVRGSNAVGGQ